MAYLIVGFGGLLGAVSRYQIGLWFASDSLTGPEPGFPVATLLVNVIGSFVIGLLACWGMTSAGSGLSENLRLLFITGYLGAFTTFSAFSLDTLLLIQAGHLLRAGGNVVLNLALCLLAVSVGCLLANRLPA